MSSPYVRQVDDHLVSGPALVALLRAVLERDAPFRFVAPGCSMSPSIRDGDTVTVEPLRGRPLHPGDVVAFLRPGQDAGERLVIHRVVAEEGGRPVLRGDNCPEPDGPVSLAGIVGLVTRVERRGRPVRGVLGCGGRWIAWLSSRDLILPLNRALSIPWRLGGALRQRWQHIRATARGSP